ncbi:hypothetical protein [Chengkuizengella axinellae]|uniref:Uncharacterized protein n=1 Tax=Chengkuizengella axinellae TaxID=3064388 RepID=A0ABT9J482_9BACL|nr:hypothetical protein [Chengkuizengella sp. 2205SS18-9]MDP5276399.1 hypothetical protein [Chengkuizengella sp. 2205SS18-9]
MTITNKKTFAWRNVDGPKHFLPEIYAVDLNDDQKKEIAVVLTTGYGIGMHYSELHVFDHYMLFEARVEDAEIALMRKFSGIVSNEGVKIIIDGEEAYVVPYEEIETIEESHLFKKAVIRNHITYNVENNTLSANSRSTNYTSYVYW